MSWLSRVASLFQVDQTPSTVPKPLQLLSDQAGNAFSALVVLAVTVVVLRIARAWMGSAMGRGRVDLNTQILILRFASIGIVVVGLVTALGVLGVYPTALVTVVGAVGLAFSLAFQDILKNFFSGVYLLLERPFRVGDVIKVKDSVGTVEHIGVRTTALRTPDNVQVLVPNAIVISEVVSNQTHMRASEKDESAGDGKAGASGPPPGAARGRRAAPRPE